MKAAHILPLVKRDNPVYFGKGNDKAFGLKRRAFRQLDDGRVFMIEHTVFVASNGDEFPNYTLRPITTKLDEWGNTSRHIGLPIDFDSWRQATDFLINLEVEAQANTTEAF